jgi:GH43 family beta-xylosidase
VNGGGYISHDCWNPEIHDNNSALVILFAIAGSSRRGSLLFIKPNNHWISRK